ncbi:Hypothetical predicted protein [Olea europaea subsp. europaea]|uniref:High mobility group B protein 6 n=1 Tax=Olea europaea subsp. europaea TaxID=158383 RepID=A0A8S0TTG5_OLEEU|nr:Hypothetical predicted protein [Olea europaea subsp. europaea]
MVASQSPLSGHQSIPQPKSGRKPLQPKNTLLTPITSIENPKLKQNPDWIEISLVDNSNKENFAPSNCYATPIKAPIESFDASLAEELSAIREKLERLRIDKEKTEKMLKERDSILDMKMKELVQRGEVQKHLEIEVDRLYRLNEIKLSCKRISPLRSLRDKERENNTHEDQNKGNKRDEQKCESPLLQSPKSEQEAGNRS